MPLLVRPDDQQRREPGIPALYQRPKQHDGGDGDGGFSVQRWSSLAELLMPAGSLTRNSRNSWRIDRASLRRAKAPVAPGALNTGPVGDPAVAAARRPNARSQRSTPGEICPVPPVGVSECPKSEVRKPVPPPSPPFF